MLLMLAGLVVFLGAHLFTTMRAPRAGLIAKIGEGPYKGLYSLISLAGLLMIVYGFGFWRAAGSPQLWHPPFWTRHLALALMLPAAFAFVAAQVPSRIKAWLKHPLLVSIKLWALAHLIANGDLAGAVLFGAFLAYAVYDRIAVKYRDERPPVAPKGWRGDVIVVVVGVALYFATIYIFHPYAVGVPLLPM